MLPLPARAQRTFWVRSEVLEVRGLIRGSSVMRAHALIAFRAAEDDVLLSLSDHQGIFDADDPAVQFALSSFGHLANAWSVIPYGQLVHLRPKSRVLSDRMVSASARGSLLVVRLKRFNGFRVVFGCSRSVRLQLDSFRSFLRERNWTAAIQTRGALCTLRSQFARAARVTPTRSCSAAWTRCRRPRGSRPALRSRFAGRSGRARRAASGTSRPS